MRYLSILSVFLFWAFSPISHATTATEALEACHDQLATVCHDPQATGECWVEQCYFDEYPAYPNWGQYIAQSLNPDTGSPANWGNYVYNEYCPATGQSITQLGCVCPVGQVVVDNACVEDSDPATYEEIGVCLTAITYGDSFDPYGIDVLIQGPRRRLGGGEGAPAATAGVQTELDCADPNEICWVVSGPGTSGDSGRGIQIQIPPGGTSDVGGIVSVRVVDPQNCAPHTGFTGFGYLKIKKFGPLHSDSYSQSDEPFHHEPIEGRAYHDDVKSNDVIEVYEDDFPDYADDL